MADTTLQLEAPGPGSWNLDTIHIPRPVSRFHAEVVPPNFDAAFAAMFARYGMPVTGLQQRILSGFCYTTMAPLDPAEFGDRVTAAEEVVATRRWRTDLAEWDAETKPAAIRRHRELSDVDLVALSNAELADHLRVCADHAGRMIQQHHRYNAAAMVPVGDLLASVQEWTAGEVATNEVLALFAGASPVSRGHCPELDAVAEALAADRVAGGLLADDDLAPAAAIERLRDPAFVQPTTAEAVQEWLAVVGQRIVDGFDVTHPRAVERPDVLLSCLRSAGRPVAAPDPSSVRDRIPPEHRDAFDEKLGEALLTYRLRDERGIYSDATAFGIMRRAMLAAGDRLVASGHLDDRELATDAGIEELVALLDGAASPTVDELRARRTFRETHTVADAPLLLGDPPGPPPPLELLPPAVAFVTRAFIAVSGHMGTPAREAQGEAGQPGDRRLVGIAASAGRHEGTARLVQSVDDLDRVGDGDVIVAITTAEAFNLALSLASAVVTDQGGLMSHAAILAREHGIPAVVGTHHATTSIPDGARVVVDGATGEVSW